MASHFGLELSQARAWLKRAEADGMLESKPRPRGYVVVGSGQDRLFATEPS